MTSRSAVALLLGMALFLLACGITILALGGTLKFLAVIPLAQAMMFTGVALRRKP
jgi:membrane protein implicated in regulation of membrane protease activity